MRCRVCFETDLSPLFLAVDGSSWHRCLCCGSDTSDAGYASTEYNSTYLTHLSDQLGGLDGCAAALAQNADWFGEPSGDRTFLDVGCLEGGALKAMADRGWSVHGFDVIPEAKTGSHVTVAPTFAASLFPRQYRTILCREVIEHVAEWRGLLSELAAALQLGGLIQVQTPRPWYSLNPIPYQRYHMQLFSPMALRYWLNTVGLEIIELRLWEMGQAFLCRRPS